MAKLKKPVKKKFFPVEIPILKKEIEAYSADIISLNEKNITLDLTPELKGKPLEVRFIISANETKATAIPLGTKLISTYLKRMTRKGTDYSEDSFVTRCKDKKIKIKPIMITRKRVTKKVLKGLRNEAKNELITWAEKKSFEQLVKEVIQGEIQKELLVKLKKIYPLSLCEIKSLSIEKEEYEEKEEQKEEAEKIIEEKIEETKEQETKE